MKNNKIVSSPELFKDIYHTNDLFITSDIHFFHLNICKYSNRKDPKTNEIFSDINRMNDIIIENWNKKISKKDTVIICGDLALGGKSKAQELDLILKKLNYKELYLIPGNHDTYVLQEPCVKNFTDILPPIYTFKVLDDLNKYHYVVASHYPLLSWPGSEKGSYMLYGHTHHNLPPNLKRKTIDVGVDGPSYNLSPLSFNEIIEIMKKHENESVDHH